MACKARRAVGPTVRFARGARCRWTDAAPCSPVRCQRREARDTSPPVANRSSYDRTPEPFTPPKLPFNLSFPPFDEFYFTRGFRSATIGTLLACVGRLDCDGVDVNAGFQRT